MIRPAPAVVPIEYPSSDGRPMAENDAQRDAIMYGISALTRHFKRSPDVYVSGDLPIYYEEGNSACASTGSMTRRESICPRVCRASD